METEARDAALLKIARKTLHLDTLDTRHRGSDFSDQAVWILKEALEAAYEAGRLATTQPVAR